jgi:carboxymethylenebutenolidase
MSQFLTVQTPDGAFQAYVARPSAPSAPVVVVLHEVFGVNDDMRMTCDELAAKGFLAVAPDLFWRQEPGVDLNAWSEPEWKKGLALYTAYDRDQGVKDILAAVEVARTMPGSSGKVAVMGFCLGGLMAFLTAARGEADAVVAYHGGDTEKYLDEAPAVAAPLLMHLADEDEFISKEAQAQIKAAFAAAPNATVYSYPGRNHAFARHTGAHYHAADAALANDRTWTFLARALA